MAIVAVLIIAALIILIVVYSIGESREVPITEEKILYKKKGIIRNFNIIRSLSPKFKSRD